MRILNVMSESNVRQWCCLFREGGMNIHDEEHSGHLTVITDNSLEK